VVSKWAPSFSNVTLSTGGLPRRCSVAAARRLSLTR
jgi:hypothetical protein